MSSSISISSTRSSDFVTPPTVPAPAVLISACPVCSQIIHDPHQVSCCGNSFCYLCIERIKANKNPCPTCRKRRFFTFFDKRFTFSQRVYCSHQKDGCEWTGELRHLDSHLNTDLQPENHLDGCQFVELHCIYGCGAKVQRRYMRTHQIKYCINAKRPFSCEYCHNYNSNIDNVIHNHWRVCGSFPLHCPNECGLELQRCNKYTHVANECPLTLISCDLLHKGCTVKLPRKDMPKHLVEKHPKHLVEKRPKHITKQIARLTVKNEKRENQNRKLKQNMESTAKYVQFQQDLQMRYSKKNQELKARIAEHLAQQNVIILILLAIVFLNTAAVIMDYIYVNPRPLTPQKNSLGSVPLTIGTVGYMSLDITQEQQYFEWRDHGFSIHIPKNALLPFNSDCVVNICSSTSGNYSFPANYTLVSAVYWIQLSSSCKFAKPLTIQIQHCATQNHRSRLTFVKTDLITNKIPPYHFQVYQRGVFFEDSSYGTLQVTRFSAFAIVCNETEQEPIERYYSAQLFYWLKAKQKWEIHLAITWDTPVHNKEVDNYYKEQRNKYDVHKGACEVMQLVKNEVELNMSIDGVQINGWKLTPLTTPSIRRQQIDYFGPGKRIPRYLLSAREETSALELFHRLTLIGAKEPNNIITIDIDPWQGWTKSVTRPNIETDTGDRPLLKDLRSFKTKNMGRIDIVTKIGADYQKFGVLLLENESRLRNTELSCQYRTECVVNDLLVDWLAGKGVSPVTWDTLIDVLMKTGLRVLANDIKEACTID